MKIINTLTEYEIQYIKYGLDICDNKEYEKLLKKIGINQNKFKALGVIYIKDGKVISYINDIPDDETVRVFVREYQLKPER